MKEQRVAARYAKSLLDLAAEYNLLEQVYQDMKGVLHICTIEPLFVTVMHNPIVAEGKKQAILTQLFQGRIQDISLRLLLLMARKKREAIVKEIAQEFILLYQAKVGIVQAEVITVEPLTDSQRENFISMVRRDGQTRVELTETINASIVGGFILKIGDKQVDQSIASKLTKLKQNLLDHTYIAKY
ncbi:MAG: ATP synthase F1 subunit delta [Cytophagaceae bacterium]|jgi:F-type H+-transporting ATPase subunit delta|nr:ATP synthase F1 subunit delta [Cytophagaceae bacterium]